MNNPEANFMSPLRSATGQPMKKQRGGSTPKSRSGSASAADDAIARRRAELRRLQQQRSSASKSSGSRRPQVTSTSELLSKGKTTGPPPTNTAPPLIPAPENNERVRHSDLFPSVQHKTPGMGKPPVAGSGPPTNISTMNVPAGSGKPPAASSSGPPPTGAATGNRSAPPPPPVARRLEFSSSNSRAKSAPPARPPPPPPGKKATASKEAPPKIQRGSQTPAPRRPAPMSASNLLSSKNEPPKMASATPKASAAGGPPKAFGGAPPKMDVAGKTPSDFPVGSKTPSGKASEEPPIQTSAPPLFSPGNIPSMTAASGPSVDAKTPKSLSASNDAPPSTARRDKIRSLREGLDSPPSSKKTLNLTGNGAVGTETTRRLESAYKDAEKAKLEALKQVRDLEEKLKTATSNGLNSDSLHQVLHLVDSQGEQAALRWARDQVAGKPAPTVGFLSPMGGFPNSPAAGLMSPETPIRRKISQRIMTPHPKQAADGNVTPLQLEKAHLQHFREAAECTPFEYSSELATFVIRRPYGIETQPQLFDAVEATLFPDYRRKSHVSDIATIEVAVTVHADNSLMLLTGAAGVRYRTNPNGPFKNIENVDELDRPLGNVSYIDTDANEKDYSLDGILEEAVMVREQYCSTILSTAMGLKDRPVKEKIVEVVSPPKLEKAPTKEMGVGTDPQLAAASKKDGQGKEQAPPKQKVQQQAPPPIEDEPSAGDVLTIFMGMIFKTIFGTIWWFLVTLPVKTITTSLILFASFAVMSLMYMYALEDHNGHLIGGVGTTSYHSNSPGLF